MHLSKRRGFLSGLVAMAVGSVTVWAAPRRPAPVFDRVTYLEPVLRGRVDEPTTRLVTDYLGCSLLLTREEWAWGGEAGLELKVRNAVASMREHAIEGWGPFEPKVA